MSPRRNTPSVPSRARYTAGAALTLAGLAACSAERVTAPDHAAPARAVPAAAAHAIAPLAPLAPLATDVVRRLTAPTLSALATTFRTTPADIEAPMTRPLDLACGVQGVYPVRKRVGRSGGSIFFGRSELRIPSGALSADTDISATVTLGRGVHVDFQPHGLQFAKAAELRIDWTGCTAPPGSSVNLYYTDDDDRITQVMPSATTSPTTARILTDHFSGFTVGWGRTDYAAE